MAEEEYEAFVFLRIHLPREIESTPKSMEQVFYNIHGMVGYVRTADKIIWRERQPWFSLELVGMNGSLYFIAVIEKKRRSVLEAALYSEYPDIEIEEVEDYTLTLPLDIPNKDWTMRGYDYVLAKPDIWQFKTYSDWEIAEESEVGRKIDPIAQFAEACSGLKPGEMLWLQLVISPVASNEKNWLKKAQAARLEFDRRSGKKKSTGEEVMAGVEDFFRIITGQELPQDDKPEEKLRFPTTLEVLAVKALGSKLERPVFDINFRGMYIAQQDIYSRSRHALLRGFVRPFASFTDNYFRFHEKTETRITHFPHFFTEKRIDIKRRRFIWYYRMRFLRQEETEFEDVMGFEFGKENLIYRLNTLELATIFHFPGREVAAPSLRRLPFKKTKAPVELPTV